jgi:hypothetical protein
MNISLEGVTKLYNEIHREHSEVSIKNLMDALEYESRKEWIDPEDLWDQAIVSPSMISTHCHRVCQIHADRTKDSNLKNRAPNYA